MVEQTDTFEACKRRVDAVRLPASDWLDHDAYRRAVIEVQALCCPPETTPASASEVQHNQQGKTRTRK